MTSDIGSNIRLLKQQIPGPVKIVAVSKTKPVSDIMAAYNAGHRIFGENRVNELLAKKKDLPSDIEWHFVGHLQTNKVKQLVGNVDMIHSVDSFRLLATIDKESEKAGKITDCLLQFHIAREETKQGFSIEEAEQVFITGQIENFQNVKISGVMGMATFTDNQEMVRSEFRQLRAYFETLRALNFSNRICFNELSMGMSEDYMIAIGEGATIIRIGSIIFGERNRT